MNYDALSPRTYEDRNGNEKTAWTRVGRAFEKDGKITVFLDAYPVPDGDTVKIVLMEPREREQRQQPQRGGGQAPRERGALVDDDGDEIPFIHTGGVEGR